MTRKNKENEEVPQTTNESSPETPATRPLSIEEIIGDHVDPSNSLAVRIDGKTVIVNSTQVSRENVDGIVMDLEGTGYSLIVVDRDPFTVDVGSTRIVKGGLNQ